MENVIRLATILDCEGWITIQKVPNNRGVGLALCLGVGNTNPKLTSWLKANFGGSVYLRKRSEDQHKDYWTWRIYGNKAAELLKACKSHFLLKEQQADLGIRFQESMHSKSYHNEPCTPEYVSKMWKLKKELARLNRKGKLLPAETKRDDTKPEPVSGGEAIVRTSVKAEEPNGNTLAHALPRE